jgi:hypothetical protein
MCITLTKNGVSLYGNPMALQSLAEWLSWIASANASEHCHFHIPWHLENLFRKPGTPNKIWFLFDRRMSRAVGKPKKAEMGFDTRFDMQFMAVTKADLARLRKRQSSGLVPDDWKT